MNNFAIPEKKMKIIITTWEYLLNKGLSKASICELCKETKLAQSSLYYWFEDKDDIWISAGKYGLAKVVDKLFAFTLNHIDDPDTYFSTLLDEVEKYKYELRTALQITTSPVFGDRMREKTLEFNALYDIYGEKLIKAINCTQKAAEVFIYSIIAFVVDFAIWDDRRNSQLLIDNLQERATKWIEPDK